MTDDKIALRALLEKGSDATFLWNTISFAAQQLMELETESLCGSGHGERSPERINQRGTPARQSKAGTHRDAFVFLAQADELEIRAARDRPEHAAACHRVGHG